MVKMNILAVFAGSGIGLAGCASVPEALAPSCPPGKVITYAAGCLTPDSSPRRTKAEYVPFKPLEAKPSAVSKEKDNNPFNKPGQ